jgi:hypothetical protein
VALNTLEGTLIGRCMSRHRHQEWLRFLPQIDRETPPELRRAQKSISTNLFDALH